METICLAVLNIFDKALYIENYLKIVMVLKQKQMFCFPSPDRLDVLEKLKKVKTSRFLVWEASILIKKAYQPVFYLLLIIWLR